MPVGKIKCSEHLIILTWSVGRVTGVLQESNRAVTRVWLRSSSRTSRE